MRRKLQVCAKKNMPIVVLKKYTTSSEKTKDLYMLN